MEWPVTKTGKAAVIFAGAALVVGMTLPVSYWAQLAARSDLLTAVGPYLILALAVLLVPALILSAIAVFLFKDRDPVLVLIFTLLSIMTGFLLIQLVGELIFPH